MSVYYCFTREWAALSLQGWIISKAYCKQLVSPCGEKHTYIQFRQCAGYHDCLTFAGNAFKQALRGARYFRMFFVLPLVIPVASIILVWQITFNEFGVLNNLLNHFGIAGVEWLNSKWSIAVLVLLYVWKNCGYNIILFTAGLNSILRIIMMRQVWRCRRFQMFYKYNASAFGSTIFFVFIISIINSFKVFREAYLLCGNYPPLNMYMLQHFMNNNFNNLNYQRLSTASLLMELFIVAIVF